MVNKIAFLVFFIQIIEFYSIAVEVRYIISPRNSERVVRQSTQFIILHTTEAPCPSALNKLVQNGEAHYLIDRNGCIYNIIDINRVAYHCGLSMWNNIKNLDFYSIGIEVEGYYDKDITTAQYLSLKELLYNLKKKFKINDNSILTHSMVAYGLPNRWIKTPHRGRKRCGMLFALHEIRKKLGIKDIPLYDPDVRAGRLTVGDQWLFNMLYAKNYNQPAGYLTVYDMDNAVIDKNRTPWDIAGSSYNSPNTLYIFPDGKKLRGNEIKSWKSIPTGTRVVLEKVPNNIISSVDNNFPQIIEIKSRKRAKDVIGDIWNESTTWYFLPGVDMPISGDKISSFTSEFLPEGTRIIINYCKAGTITQVKRAFDICSWRWKLPTTIYYVPSPYFLLLPGDKINDKSIQVGTTVFLPKS